MKGRADYAILRRVIDLYFESVFTNEKEDVDEENHVYLKKAEYKELGFIEEHRTALFHYILEHAPNKIYIPDSVKLRSKEYVIGNDELLQWFDKEFEITNNNDDFVQVKDLLYSSFKQSRLENKRAPVEIDPVICNCRYRRRRSLMFCSRSATGGLCSSDCTAHCGARIPNNK